MTLPHTHQSGAPCLACDIETIGELLRRNYHDVMIDEASEALDRIEAALAERDELREQLLDAHAALRSYAREPRESLDETFRKLDAAGVQLKLDPTKLEKIQAEIAAERARLSPPVEQGAGDGEAERAWDKGFDAGQASMYGDPNPNAPETPNPYPEPSK